MRKTLLLVGILALLVLIAWPVMHFSALFSARASSNCQNGNASDPLASAGCLVTTGSWSTRNYDLVYTVAFSNEQQPNGPLVVYRTSSTDLRTNVPVITIQRGPQVTTPIFFPSPKGEYLALLTPLRTGYGADLNGGSLRLLSTAGGTNSVLVPHGVAAGDQVIWAADGQRLYYHTGVQETMFLPGHQGFLTTGSDEIHQVDLGGHDVTLLSRPQDTSSLRLVGLDQSRALILTLARPHAPVSLVRLETKGPQAGLKVVATLPSDILPGNVLRVVGDAVECERVLSWQPLRTTLIRVSFVNTVSAAISQVSPLFDTTPFGQMVTALNRSSDGQVLVMSRTLSVRSDLTAEGIANVPAQQSLLLADARTGATQQITLPFGGQIVQAFWTAHVPMSQVHAVSQNAMAGMLTSAEPMTAGKDGTNASVFQQEEWILEAHSAMLFDGPRLPKMCYGNCPQGLTGAPHVSAAILHGVGYVESNWHQFNTSDYDVNGEAIGTPVESYDGGWGEFQQTWGMPPQCQSSGNCRSDASPIEYDESYNIGVGTQSLISAWNGTAGVVSSNDPNDPYKANHWFFAVWAYNGSYGNNPIDISSSQYGHWYPGASFRSIYEEYVWYFAAHQQYDSNGWTSRYLPSLGPALLPPQSDFVNTSDSFVACVSCTIPDWTSGSYDSDWVGRGAPSTQIANNFKTVFKEIGGEDIVGLPRDNGGSAAVHSWGNGLIQDFGGGSFLPGALMLANGTTAIHWVYGGVWARYVGQDHGALGCHGYPTSPLTTFANSGLGTDSYYRQNFQKGYIVWDGTRRMIASDVCA
jgi:hypothetical protein